MYFLIAVICLVYCGCGEDDDSPDPCDLPDSALNINCQDYDPCLTVDPASSNFLVRKKANFGSPVFDSLLSITLDELDTLTGGRLNFLATDEAENYEWRLSGSSQVWTGREVDIGFSSVAPGSQVEMTLTTTVINEFNCLTEEETSSFSSQTLNFKASEFNSPYRGSYIGRHCGSDESIRTLEIVEGFFISDNYFLGFPYDCFYDDGESRKVQILIYGRQFILKSDDPPSRNYCGQPIGTGKFSNDGQQIEFTYRHTNQDDSYEYRCWSGERIE